MKNLFLTLVFVLFFFNSYSQKLSTTPVGFSFSVKKEVTIPPNLKTFTSEIQSTVWPAQTSKDKAKYYLQLPVPDYTNVPSNGDLKIVLEVPKFKITKITDDIGHLKGEDIVLYYNYKPVLTISDKQNNLLGKKYLFDSTQNYMVKAEFFFYMQDLKVIFGLHKNEPEIIKQEIMKRENDLAVLIYNKTIENAQEFLQTGIKDSYVGYSGMLCSGKKGFDYTELDKAMEDGKNTLTKLTALSAKNRITADEAISNFNSLIPIWEKALSEADTINENAKINKEIAKGIRLNLAVTYLLKKDYNKSLSYLDLIPESFPKKTQMVTQGTFKEAALNLRTAINKLTLLYPNNVSIYTF